MAITGIIAEFNPLHNGHMRLIKEAKAIGKPVAAVISGNFVQRGECAAFEKGFRTKCALICGVDIVAELPVLWSMSTARNFALGGVWQLYRLGCDDIIFGSECGDISKIMSVADILCSDSFFAALTKKVNGALTFATAREAAAHELGADISILNNPNDNLGVEYILAAKKLNLPVKFKCIKREGAPHNSKYVSGDFVSASYIRQELTDGNIAFAERFMPSVLHGIITENDIADNEKLNTAVLSALRSKSAKDFENLPDLSEGLENRLYFASRAATTLENLQTQLKSKRYTHARIRRLILSAFLGFDNSFFMKTPPYVRLLGASNTGLDTLTKGVVYDVLTKPSQIKALGSDAEKVFDTECRATDVFTLTLKAPLEAGLEYKRKFLKTEDLI
ncbi:MAG: nucleotidyltransferase family protein [Clostridia bacterium]|nr:nucleotidyltransferase family protein [Clostridia bacterium]